MEEPYNPITPILIYIIVPLVGLSYYILLKRKIIAAKLTQPPVRDLFIIFFTYGGLLTLALTEFFWVWSGLASLGVFYLLFLAPIAMLIIAYKQYSIRTMSIYNKWSFNYAIGYFIIAPIAFYLLFHFTKN